MATQPANPFPPEQETVFASGRPLECPPQSHPSLQVAPSFQQHQIEESITDAVESDLGHPPFARMLRQGDWRGPESVRMSFLSTDLLFSVFNITLICYGRPLLSYLPFHLGRFAQHRFRASADDFLGFLIVYCTLTLLSCQAYGMYSINEPRPLMERGSSLLRATGFATGLLVIVARLSAFAGISPLVIASAGGLNLVTFAGWRLWHRRLIHSRILAKKQGRNVLIVGENRVARRVAESLRHNLHLGYIVVGFVSTGKEDNGQNGSDPDGECLGRLGDISRVARAHFIDEILITPPFGRDMVRQVLAEARRNRLDVKVVPELFDEVVRSSLMDYMGEIPVMSLHREPIPENDLVLKRIIDVVLSSVLLLLLHPLMLLIAIAIRLDSKGPIFYCAPRVGKKGNKFIFYKFRTMVADADQQKERLRRRNERSGPFFKISNDPRITRVGSILRKFSLDELPQLWNVLQGDMSLVGPRPHPLDDFAQYKLADLRRLDVVPGITGLWQVSARKDPSFEKNLALDLEYIENWSPWQDLKILLKTVPAVLRAHGE